MNEILELLQKNNLIELSEYNNLKNINNSIEENRINLQKQLIENNKLKHSIYKQEREEEQKLIKEIEEIISSSIFKRAKENRQFKSSINNTLEAIEREKMEICSSNNFLKQKVDDLINIIDSQKRLEEKEMKLIEKSIGKTMWKEYREFFNTDEFFEIMNICRELE